MNAEPIVDCWIGGYPRPKGSKRAWPIRRNGQVVGIGLEDSSGEKGKAWCAVVRAKVEAQRGPNAALIEGPVTLAMTFMAIRPQAHFGRRRNEKYLRPNMPVHPIGKPDVLKLARAVEDALTGVVWHDDSQVTTELLQKRYGPVPGVYIRVFASADFPETLPDDPAQMSFALK
jgi:Holliday junction resolvase RusA-like endonuclease